MYDPFVFSHQALSWANGKFKKHPFSVFSERWSTESRDFGVNDGTPQWVKDNMTKYYREGISNS